MKRTLIAATIIVLALACQDEQLIAEKSSSDLIIKTGTICGWCSMNDTLSINGNVVRYVNYTQCDNSKPTVEKIEEISSAKVDSLLSLLNFDEFKKIDLNTCNVCFDGCDTWIIIKKGTEVHQIRFTGNETQLQPIRTFVDRLNAMKTNYK